MVNVTATTGIYTYGHTLSQHDALPIYLRDHALGVRAQPLVDHARIDLDRVVLESDPRHRGSIIASPRARLRQRNFRARKRRTPTIDFWKEPAIMDDLAFARALHVLAEIGRASCRERVCQYV